MKKNSELGLTIRQMEKMVKKFKLFDNIPNLNQAKLQVYCKR